MLRKLMGGMIALMLVATLLLPVASVGAQEEEIDAGQAPVADRRDDSGSRVATGRRGTTDCRTAAGSSGGGRTVLDEPVVEEPVIEEPVAENPLSTSQSPNRTMSTPEEPPSRSTVRKSAPRIDEADEEAEENTPDDPVDGAAVATVISGASLDCDGTLTFTIAEAADETLSISVHRSACAVHRPGYGCASRSR